MKIAIALLAWMILNASELLAQCPNGRCSAPVNELPALPAQVYYPQIQAQPVVRYQYAPVPFQQVQPVVRYYPVAQVPFRQVQPITWRVISNRTVNQCPNGQCKIK